MDLRKELPFGKYKQNLLNNRINIYQKEITVHIEECAKNPELVGNTWDVLSLSHNSIEIVENREVIYNLNQVKFTLKYKDTEIKLDDLMKELKYKDGTPEFDQLFFAKLKNGRYLQDYDFGLFNFFNKNEERFFMLEDCLSNGNFCLPKYDDDKKELLSYIAKTNKNLADVLEKNAFSYEELQEESNFRKNKNKAK